MICSSSREMVPATLSKVNIMSKTFNAQHFMQHIIIMLRGMDVDLTHTSPNCQNEIRVTNGNPDAYALTLFGHTPKFGDLPNPAYKFSAFVYPQQRELLINQGTDGDQWWKIDGYTPIERMLKEHGLPYNGEDWKVKFI